MEIDTRYVDVVVRRWEEYTGQQAFWKETVIRSTLSPSNVWVKVQKGPARTLAGPNRKRNLNWRSCRLARHPRASLTRQSAPSFYEALLKEIHERCAPATRWPS